MGRGGYIGGSTIINTNQKKKKKKKKKKKLEGQRSKQWKKIQDTRLDFINLLIQAELDGNALETVPCKSIWLQSLIERSGSVSKWLLSQPEYIKLRRKK